MGVIRLQHIGLAVADHDAACDRFNRLFGLTSRDFRDDQGKGMQYDSRILLGNDCWLHIVQNWDSNSRVNQFLHNEGEGLEHIALETDDILNDVGYLRGLGELVFEKKILVADDGFEAFLYPHQTPGFTVELIQPHATSWGYPDEARDAELSTRMGIHRLQHVGIAVHDVKAASDKLERLFGLKAKRFTKGESGVDECIARMPLGNDCWLELTQSSDPESRVSQFLVSKGEGLEHIALETTSIEADVEHLRSIGVSMLDDRIDDRNSERVATIAPDQAVGVTVELIQPSSSS